MPKSIAEVEAQALLLSPEDRARLADKLLASLASDADVEDAWSAEAERRLAELECGVISGIPVQDAIVETQIRALSREDKADLVKSLIADLDGPADESVQRAWLEEAQRRHLEIVEGKVEAIPAEQVFASLRAGQKISFAINR
jgi:putative addiction module component (TIGR02574 family)